MTEEMEQRISEIGLKLLEFAREEESEFAKQHRWETALLDWCMANSELKTQTFRFIDVFPQLRSSQAVLEHIREYFPRSDDRLPAAIRTGLLLTHPEFLARKMIYEAAHYLYLKIARLFVAASNETEALAVVDRLQGDGIRCSLDLLGERTFSAAEAGGYFNRYEALIRSLGRRGQGLDRQNISVKLSALDPQFDCLDPEGTSARVRERLRELLRLARGEQVFLHIDMEEYRDRDLTLNIVRDLLAETEFKDGVPLGIVLQAYLKDADRCLDGILSWSDGLAAPLTVRLVRGAYWDHEIMNARQNHWPVPVFTRKNDTDAMFERLTERLIDHSPRVRPAIATHNIRSIAHAIACAESKNLARADYEFQLLYGMGHALMRALRRLDFSPRMYTPIGDPLWGMAYLVRRLLENVSSQSFVRRGIHERTDAGELLAPPKFSEETAERPAPSAGFAPLPPLPFFREEVREKFGRAVEAAFRHPAVAVPLVINGKERTNRKERAGVSPVDGRTAVSRAAFGDAEDARAAVEAAAAQCRRWGQVPVRERAECLRRAARWISERRHELAAAEVLEAGKPWREADGDIKEAVDYLNYYAHHAERLMTAVQMESPYDEINSLLPHPRGVAVVIAPWNFPLAILAGMSAAALVTGNPVILKPSEQAVLCGWKLFEAFRHGGVPEGVVQFLSGAGEEIGPVLVRDPRTAIIAFTGSKEVGLQIAAQANEIDSSARQLKKFIIEMGGKNAMIVDETADFDAAIPAVLESAFGYAGQKCSALSRLILLDSVADPFLARLAQAAATLKVGDPRDPAVFFGPLIGASARKRIEDAAAEAKRTGKLVFEGKSAGPEGGYYAAPVIVTDLPADSRLLCEELFGPLLAAVRVPDFQAALREANRSEFALTGGVFSRTPSHIELARREFECGNLYVNRQITGAIVGRQPFGGYRLSGTGTKAGSPGYLREFFLERTVSENVARHGFAPFDL